MRILVSGASGFIGAPLVAFLKGRRHEVATLVRREPRLPGEITWNFSGLSSCNALEGFNAVIHLAGEPLSFGRWSKAKERQILASRVEGTSNLATALARLRQPPALFISASAVGYYGNRGEELLNEGSAPGHGYLANVCCAWEKASAPIEERGARVVRTRFGIVLGPGGGALQQMLIPYRFHLGGKIGSGKQWMSWISRDDLLHAVEHILHSSSLRCPINLVSPHPIRQEEFAQTLGKVLRRPTIFPFPAWLLKVLFGLMANEMLLSSIRVEPKKLQESGFCFRYPRLEDAIRLSV